MKLREARLSAEITQADLATRLAKPQSYIAKIETGERSLTFIEYLELSEAIGIKKCSKVMPAVRAAIREQRKNGE